MSNKNVWALGFTFVFLYIVFSVDAQTPFNGYTLFNPHANATTTYLIDMDGEIVYTWECDVRFADCVYLLENGNLLRPGRDPNAQIMSGPVGGLIQEIDRSAEVVWEYTYSSATYIQHHDVCPMPNGNILILAFEKKTYNECVAAGRDPNKLKDSQLLPEHIVEVEPNGRDGGTIVWEWHLWDHLVQDYDSDKDNYGVIADHPELLDINFAAPGLMGSGKDWIHGNYVDYNEELDQIVFSSHNLNELWIIDHSTTTEEAASHAGGNCGKGGDFLYRWGNPQAYGRGTENDQKFFVVHNAHWIGPGLPGAGNIMAFNNGNKRPPDYTNYSSVDVLIPPIQGDGNYLIESGSTFGPEEQSWMYTAANPTDFFSNHLSSAQRLPNGNTLICEGTSGYFFEIDSSGTVVWDYEARMGVPRCIRYAPDYSGIQILFNTDIAHGVLHKNAVSIHNYPNPFIKKTTIYFRNLQTNAQVTIYTLDGRELFAENIKQDHIVWNTKSHASGTYIIKVQIDNNLYTQYVNVIQ